eukprot:CAMPEP_0115119904 /NCGR_PEP_ID=MMETSP0227-20121206/45367_1 /TAXON_ID=89957 /ORGANISM="Polarella glacialis, Strain CCMP 1383" /LENGTH=95 /DNA_ID=CAMNT_0002521459 /DNA_START=161 /DNA_END=446 /DNA_ORIENTATION=+
MWLAMLLFEKRRLKDLVKKHSELIGFPIALYTEIYEEEWGNQLRRLDEEKNDEDTVEVVPKIRKIEDVEEEKEMMSKLKKTRIELVKTKKISHEW